MTENQEKEVFLLLNTIVTEVRGVKSDVKEIRQTLDEHSRILNEHSQILGKHTQTLNNHSIILKRLDAKTDTIAGMVMNHETRLTKAEGNIEELRGGVH